MAYICTKNIKCANCPHYRYDPEYDGFACFAQQDESSPSESPPNTGTGSNQDTHAYYRFEAMHEEHTGGRWVGIFQALNPSERRQWSCLVTPKWYAENPDVDSKSWFTRYGYEKWHEKMERTIANFNFGYRLGWKFRVVTADDLDNLVMRGKTQVIQAFPSSHSNIA